MFKFQYSQFTRTLTNLYIIQVVLKDVHIFMIMGLL